MIVDVNDIKLIPLKDTIKLGKINDKEYLSNKFSNYVSNSRLGLLKSKGIKVFIEGLGNQEYNPSFNFGTWLHMRVLQPELFNFVEGIYTPTAKARAMALELYKGNGLEPTDDEIKIASYKIGYYKDKLTTNRIKELREKCNKFWRDRFIYEDKFPIKEGDPERIYIDEKNFNLMNNCLNSLNENNQIQSLLHPSGILETPISKNEQAFLMDFKLENSKGDSKIIHFKAKLDNFSIDFEENTITVNDLKTTSRLASEFDPTYYSYQREIAIYSYLLKLYVEKIYNMINPTIKGNFLVVSVIPEYNTRVVPMTKELFNSGFKEFKYLMKCLFNIDYEK